MLAARAYRFLVSGTDYHKRHLDRWLPRTGRIAELGCGVARVTNAYADPPRQTLGLDVNFAALQDARTVCGRPMVCADAFDLPLPAQSLTAVVALGIIEFDDTGGTRLLTEIARVLRPEGIAYLTLTRSWPRRRRAEARGRWRWRGTPVHTFTEAEVLALFQPGAPLALVFGPHACSLAWGWGPFRRLARLWPRAFVREDPTSWVYRLTFPLLRHRANSWLVVACPLRASASHAPAAPD